MSGDLLRPKGPDEESLSEGGGRYVCFPQHGTVKFLRWKSLKSEIFAVHGPNQTVVVVSVRVPQPQPQVQDCGPHLILLRPPFHRGVGGQHPAGGQSQE